MPVQVDWSEVNVTLEELIPDAGDRTGWKARAADLIDMYVKKMPAGREQRQGPRPVPGSGKELAWFAICDDPEAPDPGVRVVRVFQVD